jgi:hypothetical protein
MRAEPAGLGGNDPGLLIFDVDDRDARPSTGLRRQR